MLFISLPLFAFFIFAAIGSLSGIGVVSYILLIQHNEKALAESILFYAIVAVIVLIVCTISLITYSRRKVKNMQKIVEMARINGILAEERFKEFGALGLNLKVLYHEILEVSEKRATRITLLNNLEDTLLGFIDEPLLVIDAMGKITHATQKYISQMAEEGQHLAGSFITDLYPELDFKSVVQEAERSHSSVDCGMDKINAVFYPIHGRKNTIDAYCILFGKTSIFTLPGMKKKEPETTKKSKEKMNLFDFFTRKPKKGSHPETEKTANSGSTKENPPEKT